MPDALDNNKSPVQPPVDQSLQKESVVMDARQRAFLSVYSLASDRLAAYVRTLIRDPIVAEDVLQDLALTLWERFPDYQPDLPFLPWARGIARFKIFHAWENNKRRFVRLSDMALNQVTAAWAEEDKGPAKNVEILEHCMDGVPPQSRKLLHLRYAEELDMVTIAKRCRGTVTSVTKALSRLRTRLADCMQSRLRNYSERAQQQQESTG